jgi:hypothetical protein
MRMQWITQRAWHRNCSLFAVGGIMHPKRLQTVIGRKLDDGLLPTNAPTRLEVHRGTGAMCDACGGRIRAIDVEHEFNYRAGHPFRLHFDCAGVWVALCRERGLDLTS